MAITPNTEDGPVPLARRRLADVVHALADPIPVWDGGVCRWSDPLYLRLRGALNGKPVRRTLIRGSRPPCRSDVLALLVEIDGTVGGWEPHGKNTVERLRQLTGRGWRPQDCELVDGYSGQLERWVLAAGELHTESPRVFLHVPCPRCGERFAYRTDGAGERVRVLRVSENGCTCSACGAFWEPDRFHWLARLLGCEPLPSAG